MGKYENLILRPVGACSLQINVASIPEYQRGQLAEFAIELTHKVFAQPGEEERYQAWLAERNSKRRGDKISEERRSQ